MGCATSTASTGGNAKYADAADDSQSAGAGSAFTSVSGASHIGRCPRFPKSTPVVEPLHTDPTLERPVFPGTEGATLPAVPEHHAPSQGKPAFDDGDEDLESVHSAGDRVPEPTRAQWALRLRVEASRAASNGMTADPDQFVGAGHAIYSNDERAPAQAETLFPLVSAWAACVASAAASCPANSPLEPSRAAPTKPVALTVVALAAHTFCAANASSPYT